MPKRSKISELVVLPYVSGEDKCQGDSVIMPEMVVYYHNGMTVEQLDEAVTKFMGKEWGFDVDSMPFDELQQEVFGIDKNGNTIKVIGGFVIDKQVHAKIINSATDECGNDSAAYQTIRALKRQIRQFALKEIC